MSVLAACLHRASIVALLFFLIGCAESPAPHLLLVTLDTTRVDHLSTYGYERLTSPQLDRFARESVRYTRAWSTSAWTLPAHASLFTGLHPAAHGAQFDVKGTALRGDLRARVLDEAYVTLAELVAQRGYQSAAFVGGPWLVETFGVLQGFDHIDDEVVAQGGRPARLLTNRALAWLAETDPDRPIFLFVNYFDPHYPYAPPPGFDDLPHARDPVPSGWLVRALAGEPVRKPLQRALLDRYDGEIQAMDHQLGRLLDAWRVRTGGAADLVVVTADHGESFGEGGFYMHNGSLGEEVVRVPLLIRYPDGRGAGTVDDATVQLVDVLPIVAAELGLSLPEGVQGVLPGERRFAHLELLRNAFRVKRFGKRYDRDLEAVIDWPYKLVLEDRLEPTLYRIDADPRAESSVAATGRGEALAAELAAHRTRTGRARRVGHSEVDPETADSLRALGYIE